MIVDQVELSSHYDSYHNVGPIIKWCNNNIGNMAMWKDNVNEYNPWAHDYEFGREVFYFARNEDATAFRLRWA